MDKKHITGTVADHADAGILAALIGQQMAKDVLGTQPFQYGPGPVEFIAHHGGGAFSNDTDVIKALVVIADGLAGPELFRPSVQAGKQAFVFFHGNVFK